MAQRIIDGPSQEWLTEQQFADYLGMGIDLFRGLVKDETIPPARKYTGKTKLWHWEVVWWVSVGLKLNYLASKNRAAGSQDIEGD